MSRFYLYIFSFLYAALCCVAQDSKITVYGVVRDSDSEPLEFVTVRVAGTAVGTVTGIGGRYSLSAVSSDTVSIVFSCLGYKEITRRLIKPSGTITLNATMHRLSLDLDNIEVTDIKKQTSQMQTLDAGTSRRMISPSGNGVESMISTLAGVVSSDELSSQYSVRGGAFDENSVYINGIEVYRPMLVTSGQQEGLSVINPDMVGSVSFSSGGFQAEYADRMSSVLDIRYRRPEKLEGSLSLGLMGATAAFGQATENFSQLHGIRYRRNNSILSTLDTRGEYDPDFIDYQTNLNYRLSRQFNLSFLGNMSLNRYRFTPENRTTNFGTMDNAKRFKVYFDGNENDRFETWLGGLTLSYCHSRSSSLSLLVSGYLTNELVSHDISGEYWLDQAGTEDLNFGGELGVGRYHEHARNRLKLSVMSLALKGIFGVSRHNFSYGISVSSEKAHERSREYELLDSAGFSLPVDPDRLNMNYSLSASQDINSVRFAAFAEDNIRFESTHGFFNLNAGLRLSHWNFNNQTLFSPRASIAFVPERNSTWTFRLAGGVYYQSSMYKELRQTIITDGVGIVKLNKDIKAQQSIQAIIGSDYTFRALGRPFRLSAEVYYKKLNDLIPYEIHNLKITYLGINSSSGYTAGIDMRLFGQFVPGSDSWLSLSLMKTDELLNGIHVPRPSDRRYAMSLYFNDYFPGIPRMKFSLRGVLNDGLPVTAPHVTRDVRYFRMPAYKRLDVGLSYSLLPEIPPTRKLTGIRRVLRDATINLEVFNLFDISNVSGYYWITDVNNIRYAVPNYLTRRQINAKITLDF